MLIGKCVGLRAIEQNDLNTLMDWRNTPELRRYFREYRELNSDQHREWYENKVIQDRNTIMFAIIELSTNQLIGACGLCYIDWVNRNADFSLYIGKDGKYIDDLYAVDAAKLMIVYGFNELGMHRLWSEVYEYDHLKRSFFEQLNFTLDGRHRETLWLDGSWHNSLFYSLLRSEYNMEE